MSPSHDVAKTRAIYKKNRPLSKVYFHGFYKILYLPAPSAKSLATFISTQTISQVHHHVPRESAYHHQTRANEPYLQMQH